MLKALELSGFKSFADKTRFEFPSGITVIVGPNGSGKSNIVDALKWVLGEQSAKSLRGKDMSDVIFKGSTGPGSRKPAGSASATLVLDNSDGRLLYDSPEVSVTRRVYRSGESEYLINGQASRLKDIRNLFRGTGIGTDAYSLIEQGKVERLLQASPKDRRAVFEEAAGISRFKAKKVEAERRLERVQANLVRLADIVEEVGSRYRSIKNQASKAAKYREWTTRLQELRTFVGFRDYRILADRILTATDSASGAVEEADRCETQITEAQQQTTALEQQIEEITNEINRFQEDVAKTRESIVQTESRIEIENRRRTDVLDRISQNAKQLEMVEEKDLRLQQQLDTAVMELGSAKEIFAQTTGLVTSLAESLVSTDQELSKLRADDDARRNEHSGLLSTFNELGKSLGVLSSRVETAQAEHARSQVLLGSLESEVTRLQSEAEELLDQKNALTQEAESNDSALKSSRESVDSLEEVIATKQQELADQKSLLSGVVQRAKVISELEKKLDSGNSGIQELLRHGKEDQALGIIGLVADLIQVNVKHAALIDAALGPIAQYIVTSDDSLIRKIAVGHIRVPGRAGIISLANPPQQGSRSDRSMTEKPGIVGPADSLVETGNGEHSDFINKLLGGTWIVHSLSDAISLRENGERDCRLVTLDGELVETDGTVVVGSKSSVHGIVSRRSELRSLATQQDELNQDVARLERTIVDLRKEHANGRKQVQKLLAVNQDVSARLSDISAVYDQLQKQIERHQSQKSTTRQEFTQLAAFVAELTASLAADTDRHRKTESAIASINSILEKNKTRIEQLSPTRVETEQKLTVAKVSLARAEQQMTAQTARQQDLERQKEESSLGTSQLKVQIGTDQKAVAEAVRIAEEATEQLEKLSSRREQLADSLQTLVQQRTTVDQERKRHASSLADARSRLKKVQETVNESRLKISQYQLERDQLASRLSEDYGIDVANMAETETPEQAEDREKIDAEISDLRQKIGSLGNVNMQALAELEELELRYQNLDQQYQDLVAARDSLLKIIARINNDSRRLFAETLEAIRLNFQKLFRQTFGGGQADIILEEGVDVLEAGVEIIATPPGKPKFNNSLLSGGEKALTAVSLLMAIFQFRPSPFCVLDEVDAPFDEANIGRFIDVLKSFLGWTRFVIVTHSKKTMTAATTLYGVTMQESGVSKRVSVRFEDVSEDGQISQDAVDRSGEPDSGSADEQRTVA